jgi:hypothetical protein
MNTRQGHSLFAGASRGRTVAGYAAMTATAVGAFFWIRTLGERMALPSTAVPKAAAGTAAGNGHVLAEVLLALAVIAIMARLVGRGVEKYLKQPPVMGEILAGIMLGPSVLGAISSDAYVFLMPPEAAPYLGILAKVGVVLFMFLVGLHLDAGPLRTHSHTTLAISHASMFAPFVLGAGGARAR